MTEQPTPSLTLDEALAEDFIHLRDVTLRDAIQSWLANKMPLRDIIAIGKEYNTLAVMIKAIGGALAPVEVWGGGQVAQTARYLKEDPFINLEEINRVMPDVDLQCLYRGRQCFGFIPVSDEVQKKAIEETAKRGMKVFRVFDFMNDPENLAQSFSILKECKKEYPITIEGAVCYTMKPTDGSEPAWTNEEYANYALKLAEMGSDEIAIKNFAGKDDTNMPALIEAIRAKLHDKYPHMRVNLHSHGEKADTMAAALDAGAHKVDVAIGDLSGGPSHTNLRTVLALLLKKHGFDINSQEVLNHPVMKQLARIEEKIHEKMTIRDKFASNPTSIPMEYTSTKGNDRTMQALLESSQPGATKNVGIISESITSLDENESRVLLKRLFSNPIIKARIERSPLALGALSDIVNRIDDNHWKGMKTRYNELGITSKDEVFVRMLDIADKLWLDSGQMCPVTPGAKILTDQATRILLNYEAPGNAFDMDAFIPEYMDILTGRYGVNHGMQEKGLGDLQLRDAFLMYSALKLLDAAVNAKKALPEAEGFKSLFGDISQPDYEKIAPSVRQDDIVSASINLHAPELLPALKNTSIETFKKAVTDAAWIPEELKTSMLEALTIKRSPTPTYGLEQGKAIVKKCETDQINVVRMHDSGKPISDPDTVALLALMLHEKDDKILAGLLESMASQRSIPRAGVGLTKTGN